MMRLFRRTPKKVNPPKSNSQDIDDTAQQNDSVNNTLHDNYSSNSSDSYNSHTSLSSDGSLDNTQSNVNSVHNTDTSSHNDTVNNNTVDTIQPNSQSQPSSNTNTVNQVDKGNLPESSVNNNVNNNSVDSVEEEVKSDSDNGLESSGVSNSSETQAFLSVDSSSTLHQSRSSQSLVSNGENFEAVDRHNSKGYKNRVYEGSKPAFVRRKSYVPNAYYYPFMAPGYNYESNYSTPNYSQYYNSPNRSSESSRTQNLHGKTEPLSPSRSLDRVNETFGASFGYDYGSDFSNSPKNEPENDIKAQVQKQLKNRPSSALQILNPDTGEVVNIHTNSTKPPQPTQPNNSLNRTQLGDRVKTNSHSVVLGQPSELGDRGDGVEYSVKESDEIVEDELDGSVYSIDESVSESLSGVDQYKSWTGRSRLKIKNQPINPSEIILTLSEINPQSESLPLKEHSRSHLRKISNIPVLVQASSDPENGDLCEPNVYEIDRLICISLFVRDEENEELGSFKLVPLNYVVKKRVKKESHWRSELSIERDEITTCKLRRTNLSKKEQFKRSVRTLLNKLTVENFLVVSEKIADLYKEARDQEEVMIVVDLLHEKATLELEYSDMYADLAFLLRYSFNDSLDVGSKTTCFHKTLLNKCQDSFEEISTNHSLNKDYILGNIRFMGELFLRKILSITILKRISYTLLTTTNTNTHVNEVNGTTEGNEMSVGNNTTGNTEGNVGSIVTGGNESDGVVNPTEPDHTVNTGDTVKPSDSVKPSESTVNTNSVNSVDVVDGIKEEDSKDDKLIFDPPVNLIECFTELLTTIGYTVDQIPGGSQMLDEYIGILITLKNSAKYPTRINFKIQDLIDLRKKNWKKKLFKEKATSVSQIHKQVEQDQTRGAPEGKYVTAGLQVNRHYTQYLLDKRQYVLENNLVNGVYTINKDSTLVRDNRDDFNSNILQLFLSLPNAQEFENEWNKYKPNEHDITYTFEQMLKDTMSNKVLETCLSLTEILSLVLCKLIDSEILRAKLVNILCGDYITRLHDEVLDNPWSLMVVSRLLVLLFCNLASESKNLLQKISLPSDFSTAKKLCINIIQGVKDSGGDLGFTRRVIRRHLYSNFPTENLLFLDQI